MSLTIIDDDILFKSIILTTVHGTFAVFFFFGEENSLYKCI
jgi:hypothetical protein